MAADTHHAKSSRQSSRPPLITPSVSPPPNSWFTQVNAIPPHKRPRWASVSRSSSVRLSSGAGGPDIDVQKEREASRVRLLDTWSQLAERYSRRLDEDDIVDIRTGEIIKDNGFWRNKPTFTFGQALVSGEAEGDGGGEEAEEVSEDDGSDELDAFSEGHDVLGDTFARNLQLRSNMFTGKQGPSDADDLQEFLKAERRRKEEFGSDLDEGFEPPQNIDRDTALVSHLVTETDLDDDDGEDGANDDEDRERGSRYDWAGAISPVYESAPEELVSGDELDNWEPTEASIVVVTADSQEPSQNDSELEVEIVEPSVPQKRSSLSGKKQNPSTQLHTPPHSHSSVDLLNADTQLSLSSPVSSPTFPSSPLPPSVPPTCIKSVSTLSAKSRLQNSKVQPRDHRIASQAVIELSDDDDDGDVHGPGPSQSPSSFQLTRARNRDRSIAPEVVITTLPPQWNWDKNSVASGGAFENSRYRASDVKESSPKKIENQSGIRSGPRVVRRMRSLQPIGDQAAPRQRTPSEAIRETSPEICEPPLSPVRSARKSVKSRTNEPTAAKRSTHKRKRSSSEHAIHGPLPQALSGDKEKGKVLHKSRGTTGKRNSAVRQPVILHRSRSRSRHAVPSDDGHSSSSDGGLDHRRRHAFHRFPSTPASSIAQHAYTPHPVPAYPSDLYPSAADPRAQQIITQAMQQLATLLWTPTHSNSPSLLYHPFTPTHNRFSSAGPNFIHSTPNHPHPYPFTFDPSMSRATIPPDSPEPPSSPVKPRERRKSLVTRSQSRGRRVSFHLKQTISDHSESSMSRSPRSESSGPSAKRKIDKTVRIQNPKRSKAKGKGKGKAVIQDVPYSESEVDQDHDSEVEILRPIPIVSKRAQTPAPERGPRGRESSASTSRLRPSRTPSPMYPQDGYPSE